MIDVRNLPEGTIVPIKAKPGSWERWFVTEPPPFGTGRVGPFATLRQAFDYMRSRGYKLNESVCHEMLEYEDARYRESLDPSPITDEAHDG